MNKTGIDNGLFNAGRNSETGFRPSGAGDSRSSASATHWPRRATSQTIAGFFAKSALCALVLSVSFGLPAYADVRPTDEVVSEPISSSGIAETLCPDIQAENALLISEDGTVYFSRDASEPVKIASITKVMTAIVALENASLDTVVTVDEEAATVGESSAGLLQGDSMDLQAALYALMVPSGNDAAVAIAKCVGPLLPSYDGTNALEAFVAAMNEKAEELGCSDTLYSNPHGLDADGYESDAHSTAADVGIVVSYAMENDLFREIVDAGDSSIYVQDAQGQDREIDLVSTDELIGVYEGICGVKTGTTVEAGYCFAGAVSRDEGEFYSVVLGSPDSEARFIDTVALFDWMYGNIVEQRLINSDSFVDYQGAQTPLVANVAHAEWVDCLVPATVSDPDISARIFALAGDIEQNVTYRDLRGDVSAGDVVGSIEFVQNGTTVASCDLIATSDVAAPNVFQRIGVWFDRAVREFQNQPLQATSVCLNAPSPVSDR